MNTFIIAVVAIVVVYGVATLFRLVGQIAAAAIMVVFVPTFFIALVVVLNKMSEHVGWGGVIAGLWGACVVMALIAPRRDRPASGPVRPAA